MALDGGSTWTVTGNSYPTSLTDADSTLANIKNNGFTIYYGSSNAANNWMGGKTIKLQGGGTLTPAK